MTDLQRDPRKQYVLDKRICKDLSVTQKLYHPECRKEATKERAINPKPPKPKPKPKPNVPDLPPEPSIPYSFRVQNYQYNYRQGQSYNPILIGATTGALTGALAGEAIRYARAPPEGYTRVPTEEPRGGDIEMGEIGREPRPSARTFDELARRRSSLRFRSMRLPPDERFSPDAEEFGTGDINQPLQQEPMFDPRTGRILQTRSVGGLRYRRVLTEEPQEPTEIEMTETPAPSSIPMEEPLQEVPLNETQTVVQSRIPRLFPRAKPPSMAPPKAPTQLSVKPSQASETELTQAEANKAELISDLNNLVNESKAQQASISQAEAKLSATEVQEAGGVTTNVEYENIKSIREGDIQAQEATELEEAEGDTTADSGIELTDSTNVDLSPEDTLDTAVAEGAESGILSALKDPKNYTRPIAFLGSLAVGAGVGAGIGAVTHAVVSSADSGTNENIASEEQRQANNNKISSIITNQITNPTEYSPYAVIGNILNGVLAGNRKAIQFAGIPNTGIMTASDIKSSISSVNNELSKVDKGSQEYTELSALSSALTQASTSNSIGGEGNVVSYINSQGKSEIAFPLSKSQLATAIKVYQQNPNAFKGVDTTKLQIMGLNPKMSLGEAGATKTNIGYIPTTAIDPYQGFKNVTWNAGAGGGKNWAYFYTAKNRSTTFSSNSDIDTSAVPDTQQETLLNNNYISQVETIINAQTNPQVKAYLQYELDTFKYKIGDLPNPPTPVPKPEATPAMSAELTQLTDNLAKAKADLASIQTSIATQKSLVNTATTKVGDITQSISTQTAQQKAQANAVYQRQLQSYHTQVNAYNQQVAKNIDAEEAQTASYNISYARATNTPLNAPVGRYLTVSQIKSFQNQLASGQIKTTGVTPITTLAPTGISTSASGSPIVSQNALKTVPTTSTASASTAPVASSAPTASSAPAIPVN